MLHFSMRSYKLALVEELGKSKVLASDCCIAIHILLLNKCINELPFTPVWGHSLFNVDGLS